MTSARYAEVHRVLNDWETCAAGLIVHNETVG
jgi:hypothetical protein